MRSPIGRSRAQVEDGGGAVGAVEDFTTGAGTSAGEDEGEDEDDDDDDDDDDDAMCSAKLCPRD
jgi:hypothetical protein|tara:strand:+ start:37148 stop:37339 length:192 start_codon:yes stop_codon:yes gene_type:complete